MVSLRGLRVFLGIVGGYVSLVTLDSVGLLVVVVDLMFTWNQFCGEAQLWSSVLGFGLSPFTVVLFVSMFVESCLKGGSEPQVDQCAWRGINECRISKNPGWREERKQGSGQG